MDVGEDEASLHLGVVHDSLKRFTPEFLEHDDKRTWYFPKKVLEITWRCEGASCLADAEAIDNSKIRP
jgi:hypothetical protein